MSKSSKLIDRFKSKPKDFSWEELITMLKRLGFDELQGRGSRVRFNNEEHDCVIQLHKPHPGNILKPYMINEILRILIDGRVL